MHSIGKIFLITFTNWILTAACCGVLLGIAYAAGTKVADVIVYIFFTAIITGALSAPGFFIFFLALAVASVRLSPKELFRAAIIILCILLVISISLAFGIFEYDDYEYERIVLIGCVVIGSYLSLILHFNRFIDINK